ncbi:sugar phosphate isomerase/epimerase family protein [Phaeobacter sp. J2-8]|uniref:sugar phosphate isomerase/epimerase family protein n=1 Tax=Phaeobacter sp. J2-8 TaxID=2931394 RepID=UPI001FD3B8BA|nr:sugar phosphate isomerase/epimerase family protein [Phaeobacter sp. J2-8]MCJ7873852.1 sugar phosphate isomerase/epimerase [Phaeobacter sp. J2-8]
MSTADYGLNLYAYTFDYTAAEAVREAAAMGFPGVELMMFPGHLWPPEMGAPERRALRDALADTGTQVISINQPNLDVNLTAASPEARDYSFLTVQRMIETAGEFGGKYVIVGPGKINPLMPMAEQERLGHFHRALDRLIPIARGHGVQVLGENMPFAFLPDTETLVSAIAGYTATEVGVIYDVANGHFIAEPLRPALDRIGDRLKLVHASDTGREVYKHDPIGRGDMDWTTLGQELIDFGWSHPPVLEIIGLSEDLTAEIKDSSARLDAAGWDRIAKKRHTKGRSAA